MIVVPRRFVVGQTAAAALLATASALTHIAHTGAWRAEGLALALFLLASVVCFTGLRQQRLALPRALAGAGVAIVLPIVATAWLDPAGGDVTAGGWSVAAVSCLVILLLWRRRARFGWLALGSLVLVTLLRSGPGGLMTGGVLAALLVIGLLGGGGWALARTEQELRRYTGAEREALEWRAAQDAFHTERQVRLTVTDRLAGDMLRRIVASGGRLEPEDREACRVLEQTIRDEIRGRALLNDAVRAQVLAHRQRGAVVRMHDDGGLDALPTAAREALLDRVADAIADLRSDRIVVRTAPADSVKAISVVATTSDPVAAALGQEDDPEVDLWLELDRPLPSGPSTGVANHPIGVERRTGPRSYPRGLRGLRERRHDVDEHSVDHHTVDRYFDGAG